MSHNQKVLPPNRRTLVKGAAWAAPAVIASTTVPTYAASRCTTTTHFSGGAAYNWGTVFDPNKTTTQILTLGGQFTINNLPSDVTVTSIKYEFWTSNRIDQKSSGPGIFWIGNPSTQYSSYAVGSSSTRPIPWTESVTGYTSANGGTPTPGSGFVPVVQSTQNLVNHEYPSGAVERSWNLIMTWEASRDSNIASRYTSSSTSDCRNFTTGPSARFPIVYSNVVPPASPNNVNSTYKGETLITVTLSNGQTLTHRSTSGS